MPLNKETKPNLFKNVDMDDILSLREITLYQKFINGNMISTIKSKY